MKTIRTMLAVMLTAACCTEVTAQSVRAQGAGNNGEGTANVFRFDYFTPVTNISLTNGPQLYSDNSVKFFVRATDAQKVQVDIGGTKYDMVKGDGNIWTVRTNPLVPGFHYYSLIIDGVSVADPASQSFYGCSRWSSAIEIPEKGMDDFEVQNVPHGDVRTVHYYSKVEKAWRPLMVYTPAGYDEGKQDYPVVYIQHGGGEDHRGWMEQGRTAQIMDNLIAAGKAVPMIVVSSNSNVRSSSGGFGGGGYSWQGMQTFRSELLESVIPFVEKTYRVKNDRKNRAMCGLSMGGGQSFYIGLRDPEVFANVGVFSTGMFGGIRGASNFDLEKEVPGMLSDTETFNKQFDVFFISCGEQDPRIEYTRNIVKQMRNGGVNVRFNSYPGDHEWQVWRKSLHEFAQYLFKTSITAEMAYKGVSNYCHSTYDWSVAESNPSIMYIEMGEETDSTFQVVFRSYTGAFINFYVDKTSGKTRMEEYVPALDAKSDAGTIELFDYLP